MKRYLSILLLALLPVAVLAKGPTTAMTGTVTKVSDGDTIKVQTASGVETIRLLGVDTPEKFPTRYGYAECYGEESSHYVEGLLPIGTQVYVEFYGNDKYSRDLADVYIGSSTGTLVSREIITNGYGWVYRKGIKSKPYASLIKSETLAKRGNIGLWSNETCAGKRISASNSGVTTSTGAKTKDSSTNSKMGPDFSQIMKQNSDLTKSNLEAQKLQEEQAKRDQEERDRRNAAELKKSQESIQSQSSGSSSSSSSSSSSRTYYTGERGGCYYLNSKGNKTYVDHSYCGN